MARKRCCWLVPWPAGPLPLQQALPLAAGDGPVPAGILGPSALLQVDTFREVQELLQFDEAAVDYDGRPLITMRCRAASLREPVMGRASSITTQRGCQ